MSTDYKADGLITTQSRRYRTHSVASVVVMTLLHVRFIFRLRMSKARCTYLFKSGIPNRSYTEVYQVVRELIIFGRFIFYFQYVIFYSN